MLARLKGWADVLRDYLALLYVPVVSLLAVAMVLLLWRGGWSDSTQAERIHYFGATLLILVVTLGIGVFWLQRNTIEKLSVSAGQFQASLDLEQSHDA